MSVSRHGIFVWNTDSIYYESIWEDTMIFKFTVAAATATILTLPAAGFAQQLGTAQEARTMLDKAVAAVTADRDLALAMFNKGKDGFRDRDLYAFCARIADAKALATPLAVAAGTDVSTLKDPTGKAYGLELYATAQKPEGEVTEVSYMFPKPGTTTPAVAKVSFVTKAGDLICGVGYYK
jgi:Single Cache domain 2